MTLIAVSQDIPLAHYNLLLYFASAFSIIAFVAFIFHTKYTLKKSVVYTAIFFSFFYYLAYSKANKFYALEKDGDYLALSYVKPANNKQVLVSDIQSVLFGSANRGGNSCFISLKTFQGKVYKSTAISQKIEYCKNKRKELLTIINTKS
ncbi:hypothetical protein [Pseudocolwellia agarivorans]|uniref:hypothetical protein n=1 Tax=Pseudocolwellia agarivorans TaxID=1911682 RepID=UPI0009875BA8|nr:hypothetical protein [Pseudocolwellia agarivorans]